MQVAGSNVDNVKRDPNVLDFNVKRQPSKVNLSAEPTEVSQPAPKPSKVSSGVPRQRLFTVTRPEPSGPSEALSQPNFTNWSIWVMRLDCSIKRPRLEEDGPGEAPRLSTLNLLTLH